MCRRSWTTCQSQIWSQTLRMQKMRSNCWPITTLRKSTGRWVLTLVVWFLHLQCGNSLALCTQLVKEFLASLLEIMPQFYWILTWLTGVYQIWVSDSNVHCHHASSSGTSSSYILAPPSCCLHWVCWQANRASRTDCVHPLRGRQETQTSGNSQSWCHTSSYHLCQPEERGRCPGKGSGETWCKYNCHVTILVQNLPLKPLQWCCIACHILNPPTVVTKLISVSFVLNKRWMWHTYSGM